MLGNIGQLPGASKPTAGVNYRALAGKVARLRMELPGRWEALTEPERESLYNAAFEAATFKPKAMHLISAAPRAIQLHRSGQIGDFLDYGRMLTLLWDDVLSLSENDCVNFQRDALNAIYQAKENEPMAVLSTRENIRDFFNNL